MTKSKEFTTKPITMMSGNEDDDDDNDGFAKNAPKKPEVSKSKTPFLDTYGRDICKMADEGKLDPVVGRDVEIERICQILGRRKKNNPVIIGEAGTGKTSIVDGLALRINQKTVPMSIMGKRVISVDMGGIVAGTKYRGQFEERMKVLIDELEKNPDIILFIDELHTIIGAGGASGSLDASNILKPALSRGVIQVIGATTIDEYRKNIEKDAALDRRFQIVQIEPCTPDETVQILNNIKSRYEDHHNVTYTPEAIQACVTLSDRYINGRHFPDKAIDVMDEAGARVHIKNVKTPQNILDIEENINNIKIKKNDVVKKQKYEEAAKLRDVEKGLTAELNAARQIWEDDMKKNRETVTEDHVADVVSMISGVPIQKIGNSEKDKLSKMGDAIKSHIIGQDDAVKKVVQSIQRSRIGLSDPNKPIFVGMLIGNSGVGKTELAKQIASYMFESEDSLIRLDMSEYMEKFSVNKIIGSPSGYVGYEEGSSFLNKVRNKPYSVILLDEIEKAHADVFNIFLQMFDEGTLTDSHGRKISFKNCVILMTSNVGTRVIKDFGSGVGFKTQSRVSNSSDDVKSVLTKELKKTFPPEFINRVDETIYFQDLQKEDILKIIELELTKIYKRTDSIGYQIELDQKIKDHLVEIGYDSSTGARPLKRAIQKWVEDALTQYILENNTPQGSKMFLTYDSENDKTIVFEAKNRRKKKSDSTQDDI